MGDVALGPAAPLAGTMPRTLAAAAAQYQTAARPGLESAKWKTVGQLGMGTDPPAHRNQGNGRKKERKNYARRRVLRKGVDYRHKPATTPYQREETGDNSKASGPPCWVKASYGGRGVVRLEVSALCASMCLVCTMLCMQRMACRCSLRAQSLALARVMPSFWRACRVWMW